MRTLRRCRDCGRRVRWTCDTCGQCDACCVHWDYDTGASALDALLLVLAAASLVLALAPVFALEYQAKTTADAIVRTLQADRR